MPVRGCSLEEPVLLTARHHRPWRRRATTARVAAALFAAALSVALGATATVAPSPAAAAAVLVRGNGDEPAMLDPQRMTGRPEANIALDLFEGLMAPDAAGQPQPALAEASDTSADGLTWRFTLRADGRWSDGSPVTADDFVFAWRRLVTPASRSEYAPLLWPLVNAEAISKGQISDPAQLGVEAADPRTLVVHLRRPTPYFAATLALPATFPLPRALVQRAGDDWIKPGTIIVNGPFQLAEHVPNGQVRLVRNPAWRDAAAIKLDGVSYLPISDQDAEFNRFRAGEIDLTNEVPNQQIPAIRQSFARQYHVSPFFSTYFYDFNISREPWRSNVPLRQALSLAVDRTILVDKILQSGQVPAFSLVPPGTLAGSLPYRPQLPEAAGWSQAQRDARARELFAAAGYGPDRPLTIDLVYNTSNNHKKLAIAIAAMWKQKLGIQVNLVNQEWKVFLQTRNSRDFADLARDGWVGDYNDANSFLELLRSDIGPLNRSGYSNPDYDALMERAALERDPAGRRDLLEQAERLMLADQPILPLYTYTTRHLVADRVSGWQDNIMDLHPSRFMAVGP